MQVYVEGSDKAVELYKKAFNAELVCAYPGDAGTFYHSELDVFGQIIAVTESCYTMDCVDKNHKYSVSLVPGAPRSPGNTMQFCLHFGEGNSDKVLRAYDVLKEDALVLFPPGPVDFSPCLTDLIDQYGIRWCLFE